MNSVTSGIASVRRQAPRADKKTLDPRATRYGLIPIWAKSVAARDFYVWTIPANSVFPFRPFIGEIGQDTKGNETYRVERLPEDQISDLRRLTKHFLELPELARLTEEGAEKVEGVLMNPNRCSKYAVELGNQCATCWLEYLHSDEVNVRIASLEEKECQRAANASVRILREGIMAALGEARRLVDEAVREIDDPQKGKSQFYDHDYNNIYHTHAERPKYKTSTSNTDSAQAIADAIKALAQPAPVADAGVLADLAATVLELKAKLAEFEKGKENPYIPQDYKEQVESLIEDKAAKVKEKIKAAKED